MKAVAVIVICLASMLLEFDVVMAMQGAGEITGPQLMAEIGDVRRFTHKGALAAFAGMDAAALPVRHLRFQVPPHLQARFSSSAQDPVPDRQRYPPALRSGQSCIPFYGQKES